MANGAVFGAVYALLRPLVPGPAAGGRRDRRRWPSTSASGRSAALIDRYHPARGELEPLTGNRRAFAQATWRHAAVRRWCWASSSGA